MNNDLMLMPSMTIESVIERRNLMVDFVQKAMTPGTDYGKIPGTEKDTLLKPGAEKLNTLFRLTPKFIDVRTVEDWTGTDHKDEPFFYYWQKCQLLHDGVIVGEGDGSCNSWEKKYRYRAAERVCPQCGKPAIIKGKAEYGGGWLCFARKGGCGAKFEETAPAIVSQVTGQVPNPDIYDQANTLLKMAQKRALIAATLIAVNASEFFTQDMDDMYIGATYREVKQEDEKTEPAKQTERPKTAPIQRAEAPTPVSGPGVSVPSRANGSNTTRTHPPLSPTQRNKLTELWRILHGGSEDEVSEGLDNAFIEAYRHRMNDANYEEGARLLGKLLTDLRAKTNPA